MIQYSMVDKDYKGDDRLVEFVALELGFVKKVVEVALVEAIAAGTERMVVASAVVVGEKDFEFELFVAHSVVLVAGAGYAAPELEVEVGAECSMCFHDFEYIDLAWV